MESNNINDALEELNEAISAILGYALPDGERERVRNALDNLETAIAEEA